MTKPADSGLQIVDRIAIPDKTYTVLGCVDIGSGRINPSSNGGNASG